MEWCISPKASPSIIHSHPSTYHRISLGGTIRFRMRRMQLNISPSDWPDVPHWSNWILMAILSATVDWRFYTRVVYQANWIIYMISLSRHLLRLIFTRVSLIKSNPISQSRRKRRRQKRSPQKRSDVIIQNQFVFSLPYMLWVSLSLKCKVMSCEISLSSSKEWWLSRSIFWCTVPKAPNSSVMTIAPGERAVELNEKDKMYV